MISVGIDVSKEKSTICILKPYGEIVSRPFEVCYTEKELSELASMLLRLNDDVRVVMEATGIYHLPVLCYLKEKGLFVAVVNPFEMWWSRKRTLPGATGSWSGSSLLLLQKEAYKYLNA